MRTVILRAVGAATLLVALLAPLPVIAQQWLHADDDAKTNRSMFRPIDEWPDPNDYRGASGAPGPQYWQQQVDYVIETVLDTTNHVVSGSERITYHNNSPDVLRFLWVQLDQNVRSREHSRTYASEGALPETLSPHAREFIASTDGPFDGGFELGRVQVEDPSGSMVDADYLINNTLMKIRLPVPLEPGQVTHLEIDWSYRVPPNGLRGGRERMRDGWVYEIAQWYPRLSVYDDVNGWQTDQFLGQGEFYLEFGSFDVKITVPHDHIVQATGVLQNPEEVLTETQRKRLEQAWNSEEPVFIVRPDEVMQPETRPARSGMLTWHFRAEQVRDFAWASSKTFVWDAMGYRYSPEDDPIELHSLYARDGMPLWDKVSTRAIAQTLETYGRMAMKYPYPKASNVLGPAFGMEYPMLAFCGSRPEPDGTVLPHVENMLVLVTIHEVGHNWFPMIVASDERKWTWMDEGLNTFLQHYATLEWDANFPYLNGPKEIVDYMRDPDQVPIMTPSDLIHKSFGQNAYSKPSAGLVMLREHVMGPERFDDAFRTYTETWAFKKPQPADFFRTMEEAAGEDLAWFWRGWFYTTHANDQALRSVSSQPSDSLLGTDARGRYYYRIQIDNEGGLLMPVVLQLTYDDGTTEEVQLPVEIWKKNERSFTKGLFSDKRLTRVVLDPHEAYADIDRQDNVWEAATLQQPEDSR